MGVARIYRAYSPYPHTVVKDIDYAQSSDVVYTTHLDYPVYKATRSDHTDWAFTPVAFEPSVAIPAAPTGVASPATGTGYTPTTYEYRITAIGPGDQESRPSGILSLTNDLTIGTNRNTLTLPAMAPGVTRYVIYKKSGGSFGYIGSTDTLTFVDGNPQIQAVTSDAPPTGYNPFSGAGNYPATVTFHDQRLMLGCTRAYPNAGWGSQPVAFENMDKSSPSKADDSVSFALVAEKVNSISQMVSMGDLLVITQNGVFAVNGGEEGAPLTPSSISPRRSNSRGGSRLNPIVLDDIVFYAPAKGSGVRTLGFQFEVDGYQSNNVAIFSPHFFKGFTIIDWAYVEEPYSAIFALRSDGALLCFTWEAEQQVWGWTMLETQGTVQAIAAITEGGFDRLYALIERNINGVTKRFHERLALPHIDDMTTAAHLDCAITQIYDPPRNVISGLWHLEGATVSAHYDGFVEHDLIVENGQVKLPNDYEATIATVGLRYTGEVETLPLVLPAQGGTNHTNVQNVAGAVIRTVDTRGIRVAVDGGDLEDVVEKVGGEDGLADVSQRDYQVSLPGRWTESTTIRIVQEEPLPAHITGVFLEPKVSPR